MDPNNSEEMADQKLSDDSEDDESTRSSNWSCDSDYKSKCMEALGFHVKDLQNCWDSDESATAAKAATVCPIRSDLKVVDDAPGPSGDNKSSKAEEAQQNSRVNQKRGLDGDDDVLIKESVQCQDKSDQEPPPSKKQKLENRSVFHDAQVLKVIQRHPTPTFPEANKSSRENQTLVLVGDDEDTTSDPNNLENETPSRANSNNTLATMSPILNSSFSNACIRRRQKSVNKWVHDPNKPSWLQILPDEIVVRIFSFLSKSLLIKVARTCKKLQRIAFDETLWRRMDLGGKVVAPGVVGQLFQRGIAMLRLAKAQVKAPIFHNQFGSTFKEFQINKLQCLDLGMATIDVKSLESLLSCCHSLKKLGLENCQISEKACILLAKRNCGTLDTLHMAMVTGLTSRGLCAIVKLCKRLSELNLAWTQLAEESLDQICDCFPRSLKKLNISGCRTSLNPRHITQIHSSCPDLVELDISDCTSLEFDCLAFIARNFLQLEILSTSRCYGINPVSYLQLKFSSIKYLNIFGSLKETALAELRKRLPAIEINKILLSSIARPTVGIKRTSIWNYRVRD